MNKAIRYLAPAVAMFALFAESGPGFSQGAGPGAAQPGPGMMGPGAKGPGMMGPGMMGPGMMGPGMMGPGMMGRGPMWGMMGGGCPMMGGPGEAGSSYSAGRIAFLKAELAITDDQKSVWDAYAAALTKNLESMQSMHQAMMATMQAASPVERLDAHIEAMDTRLAALRAIKPALTDLYGKLTPEQKTKADALLTGMGCMM